MMGFAESAYARWLMAGPIERLQIKPDAKDELTNTRLDRRVTGLLLQAIPSGLKADLVASRELTCSEIVFRILKTYQPGGLNERAEVLSQLTTQVSAKNASEAVETLRFGSGATVVQKS